MRKQGVRRILPRGCLPLRVREGVTLASVRDETNDEKELHQIPFLRSGRQALHRVDLWSTSVPKVNNEIICTGELRGGDLKRFLKQDLMEIGFE